MLCISVESCGSAVTNLKLKSQILQFILTKGVGKGGGGGKKGNNGARNSKLSNKDLWIKGLCLWE